MRFVSYAYGQKSGFGLLQGDKIVPLSGVAAPEIVTLRDFLTSEPDLAALPSRRSAVQPCLALADVTLLPVVPDPSKIFCIGVNYDTHREETGRAKLAYPIVFIRVADSQIGHGRGLVKPAVSEQFDHEGELVFVKNLQGTEVSDFEPVIHGPSSSLYFRHPEGNRVEVFVDSDWYIPPPVEELLDFSLGEAEIRRRTLDYCSAQPGFRPMREWREEISAHMRSSHQRTIAA